jgi:hypothetical protein
MIKITFPDGSVREYEEGITPLEIAKSISRRLAEEVLAASVNDETWDLTRPITEDATLKLLKWEDEEGKHAYWHSSAHLMAEALQELYPGIKFGIGPAIENGFYYDVDPGEGVVIKESDFPVIEKERLANHLDYFVETLDNEQSQGRKLGFIAQEIGREINTMGAKSNHSEIQRLVVQMKDELEQIKEQVLNVL